MAVEANPYDEAATEYAELVAVERIGSTSPIQPPVLPRLLDYMGDVAERSILDAASS